mmetsp:Transcript_31714/g.75310  ORF Transcript_31714/g.75310 Transcript_31714/m.75310 type:complete len:284 (-) Transcript_31714:226-1077(-)
MKAAETGMGTAPPSGVAAVFGGVLAGTLAVPCVFPLTALQVTRQVAGNASVAAESLSGLGWAIGSALAGHSAYFASFELLFAPKASGNRIWDKLTKTIPPTAILLFRTILSSTMATIVNTPFEVMKTRSIAGGEAVQPIPLGFELIRRGFPGNLGGLLGGAIQFTTYHSLMPYVYKGLPNHVSAKVVAVISAAVGVLSSFVATTLVFPIDTVKSVIMAAEASPESFLSAMFAVYDQRGFAGFYDGVAYALCQNAATAGIMFLAYPILTRYAASLLSKKKIARD